MKMTKNLYAYSRATIAIAILAFTSLGHADADNPWVVGFGVNAVNMEDTEKTPDQKNICVSKGTKGCKLIDEPVAIKAGAKSLTKGGIPAKGVAPESVKKR